MKTLSVGSIAVTALDVSGTANDQNVATWTGSGWSGMGHVDHDVHALATYRDAITPGPSLFAGGAFAFVDGGPSGVGASGTCDALCTLDFNAWMQADRDRAPNVRSLVSMQTWFRDPGNGSNQHTSLSDALRFGVAP